MSVSNNKQTTVFTKSYPLPKKGQSISIGLLRPGDIPVESVVLSSVLLDIKRGFLLLKQTNPPITSRWVGQRMEFSYLINNYGNLERIGFKAALRSVIQLPENGQFILLTEVPQSPAPLSLRKLMRIIPPENFDLAASLQLEGLSLPMDAVKDISLGGIKLAHRGELPLPDGQRLGLTLSWQNKTILTPGYILRQDQYNEESALIVRFADLTEEQKGNLRILLNLLGQQQRKARLVKSAQELASQNPNSFFSGNNE